MTAVTDEAVEAAAKAICEQMWCATYGGENDYATKLGHDFAEVAVRATVPLLREQIAREIEATFDRLYGGLRLDMTERSIVSAAKHCARIARGVRS